MTDYIDKSFVIYVLNHFGSMQTWSIKDIISECKRKIESEKAADVAPVVHAKWVFNGICTSCSACGSNKPTKAHDHKLASREVRFCYFCGAKMDLEESK